MKRLICTLLLCILVFCLSPGSALAANNRYDLDDIGLRVTLPDDHIVFTRNIDSDDPSLSLFGVTNDEFVSAMNSQNIYLDIWEPELCYEIFITMMESPLGDFNLYSDTSLNVLASSFAEEYATVGITLIDYSIYHHNQAKFIKIYFSQPNGDSTAYGLQYHTVYDDKAYNITMRTVSGELDFERESILNHIVDSVSFYADSVEMEKPVQTSAFVYTDPISGLTFTVPENWVETPMFEDREYIDAKFTSTIEEGLAIIFTCEDLWSGFSPSEQFLRSRKDIDHSILTVEVAAEAMACDVDKVSEITIGEIDYFCGEALYESTMYGLTFSVPSTVLLHVENGYMFMFQFSGFTDNEFFDDFESLVASVDYSGVYANSDSSAKTILICSSLIVAALLVMMVFFVKKSSAKKKRIVSPSQSIQTKSSNIAFCHKCGNRIEEHSLFCNKCGATIPAKENK